MITDKDPALLGGTYRALTLRQPPFHQHRLHRATSPDIGPGIEGIAENIADQALRGNFPDELCPPDRVRRELHLVIAKPLERLAHAPEFPKLREDELNGFANPPVGMKHDLTHGIQGIPDRKPLEQLTTARFGLLPLLQPLPKNLQLHDTQRPLDPQDQLVVEIIQVIDLLLVSQESSKDLANLEQPAPVLVGPG